MAVVPLAQGSPAGGGTSTGLGGTEFAANYRFRHQESFRWSDAVFALSLYREIRVSQGVAIAELELTTRSAWTYENFISLPTLTRKLLRALGFAPIYRACCSC